MITAAELQGYAPITMRGVKRRELMVSGDEGDWALEMKRRRLREASARWRKNHPERAKATVKAYRQRNRSAEAARKAAWQKANPQKANQVKQRWARAQYALNPEKHRERVRQYRARKKAEAMAEKPSV